MNEVETMPGTRSSRTRRALAACTVAMALSGFSPKDEAILRPNAAHAQYSDFPPPVRSPPVDPTYVPRPSSAPPYVPSIPSYQVPAHERRIKKPELAVMDVACRFYLERMKSGSPPERIDALANAWYPCRAPAGAARESFSAVRAALHDPDWKVRAGAAQTIGRAVDAGRAGSDSVAPNLKFERTVPQLMRLLGDMHMEVRRNAAETLGKIGDGRASARLEEMSRDDPDEAVRKIAASAAAKIDESAD